MNIKVLITFFSVVLLSACAQEGGAPADVAQQAASTAATAREGAVAEAGAAAASVSVADVEALVAAADPELGKRQFIFCQACHSTQSGGANKVGPNLYGVVGRAAAKGAGFIYSAPLTDSGLVWDVAALDEWIERPAGLVPGTTMIFAGIKDPQGRANLIAYLQKVTSE
jgi:cytochrome c